MKLLHSADWHLDSPSAGLPALRQALLDIPERVVQTALEHACDLILLSGDLFDGPASPESYQRVYEALRSAQIPVFISPGNHDPVTADSVWLTRQWPDNVHIFKANQPQSVVLPHLDCRVYGGAFTGPESGAMLHQFRANAQERYCIGVFHGDPLVLSSPYNPVTALQAERSGLDYLALGHIHKTGQLRRGSTLCAWPGCPMGRGFDETGEKGVLLVTLQGRCQAEFLPLATARFFRQEVEVRGDPISALAEVLPAGESRDFYRITLTGEAADFSEDQLKAHFSNLPNLSVCDRTTHPADPWETAGEDTLEGVFFASLQQAMEDADPDTQRRLALAARLSRQILRGQEVKLP